LDAINSVRIQFRAGYDEDASGNSGVPPPIKTAIKVTVADWYDNRESVTPQSVNKVDLPASVERLLHQFRIHAFA
jgi:uncharacterized phiE125 gp8 family phage protein